MLVAGAVRGGGHNVAGTAVLDDGLVIDLSNLRGVQIDPSGRSVHVQGGATWADGPRSNCAGGMERRYPRRTPPVNRADQAPT